MNCYILNKFIPDEYTLKYKCSVDKFIISSHRMEMMSMSCKVSVDIIIWFIYILKSLGTLSWDIVYINNV